MVEETICPFDCYITHLCHFAARANTRLYKASLWVIPYVDSWRGGPLAWLPVEEYRDQHPQTMLTKFLAECF